MIEQRKFKQFLTIFEQIKKAFEKIDEKRDET